MKKVLFVISTLHGGGAERTLCNLTKGLPPEVEIDILVNWEEPEKDYEHRGNVISAAKPSTKVIRIPYPIKLFFCKYYRLRKLKKNNTYDACISFMEDSNIMNIITGKKYCKTIISIRTSLSSITDKKYVKKIRIAKRIYDRADGVVAISKGVEEDLIQNFSIRKNKIVTIYNGHDSKEIIAKSKETADFSFESELFYFLNIGRLCYPKGQWHLLKVFKVVSERHPDSRLIICGDGEYRDYLKKIAKQLKIEDKVIFTNFVKNPFAYIDQADVFVFPSLYEGLGNVVIENLICGKPIIASDYVAGAREILAPKTDYYYSNKDKVEHADYGIIVPVCSGNRENIFGELEKEEKLLLQAMLEMKEKQEMRAEYQEKAGRRGQDFEVRNIAKEWMEFIDLI